MAIDTIQNASFDDFKGHKKEIRNLKARIDSYLNFPKKIQDIKKNQLLIIEHVTMKGIAQVVAANTEGINFEKEETDFNVLCDIPQKRKYIEAPFWWYLAFRYESRCHKIVVIFYDEGKSHDIYLIKGPKKMIRYEAPPVGCINNTPEQEALYWKWY